jgi:hypothetical protein
MTQPVTLQGRFRPGRLSRGLTALGIVVPTLWVQKLPLWMFFGPDDLIHMEQATGLLPPPASALRLFSQVAYFKLMLAVFGPAPFPFHVVSLALHAINACLLWRVLLRAGIPGVAAFLAALGFGCFPLHYATLLYAVGINDVLACFFALLALWLLQRLTRTAAVLAALGFAVGLLCKESILALPLVFPFLLGTSNRGVRARAIFPVVLVGLAFVFVYAALRPFGLAPGGSAYAIDLGPHALANVVTYAAWAAEWRNALPDLGEVASAGAIVPGVLWLAIAALCAAFIPGLRRPCGAGLLWFVAAGLPVFVLAHHAYVHYLYVPVIGSALALGGVTSHLWVSAESVMGRLFHVSPVARGARRQRFVHAGFAMLAGIVVLFAVGRADDLVHERMYTTMPDIALPRDPATRKAELAGRAVASIQASIDRTEPSLTLFAPPGQAMVYGTLSGRRFSSAPQVSAYDVLDEVLDHGRALRLFAPWVRRVRFTTNWRDAIAGGQIFWRVPDGRLVSLGSGAAAQRALAGALVASGEPGEARALLEALGATRNPDARASAAGPRSGDLPRP